MAQSLRKDVHIDETWDVSKLFSSRDKWLTSLNTIGESVNKVTDYKGRLTSSASTLFNALQAFEEVYEQLTKIRTYAFLRTSIDGTNEEYQADLGKTANMLANVGAQLAFFEPELLTLEQAQLTQFIEEEPRLKTYQKVLK